MAENETNYEMHGRVTGTGGQGVSGAEIFVWWKRIRSRVELASGKTDDEGFYRLKYKVPQKAPQPALIIAEARSEHLAAPIFSPLTEAQPDLLLDLHSVAPDESEWATLRGSIDRLLDGLKLADLVENNDRRHVSSPRIEV